MAPFKLVYHTHYNFELGSHIFPSQKYRLIREQLLRDGLAIEQDFVEPDPALDQDLTLAHTSDWIRRLRSGLLTFEEITRLEIPWSENLMRGFRLHTGGSILAARLAIADGFAFHIGGGFHHAYPGHGEGFCAVNDIAVAIRRAQTGGLIRKAMVVDCDVHHGNGTAAIFAGDASVFTLSIHQLSNYPDHKPSSTLDIDLEDGVGDEEYLAKLHAGYERALRAFSPDLILYVAGADPHRTDRLGGLDLSMDGLLRRDKLILHLAIERRVPVAIVLAGGYSEEVRDTVTIHCNTLRAARNANVPGARQSCGTVS